MGITVELNPEAHALLAAEARARGIDVATYASRLLDEAARNSATKPAIQTPAEVRAWLDELAQYSDLIPPMPNETFSREMIYQEHD
jgi:hypothetical protein